MKILLLVALIALTTASYFQPEQLHENVKLPEEEENYREHPYPPTENSYSNDSEYSVSSESSDSSDSSDSDSENEDDHRRGRPQMRGSHNGEGRQQQGQGPQHKCQGKQQRVQMKDMNGNEFRKPNHRQPDHRKPRPQPDEFDLQAFHTIKEIGHGIMEEWKLAGDPALKNEIRAALIAKLENLLPVAEIPKPEVQPVPVPAPEMINFEQVRVIEEGGN